jgi:predicted nucleotidyltransferase
VQLFKHVAAPFGWFAVADADIGDFFGRGSPKTGDRSATGESRRRRLQRWRWMTDHADRLLPREALRQRRTSVLSLLLERGGRDVRVFGSVARGDDDSQSDVDLLVELPEAGSNWGGVADCARPLRELTELVGARVDVVTPRTLRDEGRDAALAEAIPL